MQIYSELGLKLDMAAKAEDAGVYEMWQLLAEGKLKVFKTLTALLSEYRLGNEKVERLLLTCCHSMVVSGRDQMRIQPVKQAGDVGQGYLGEYSWMQ